MSKWVIGKYIRLSLADQDLMKKEGKTESESISHQKALIQNYIDGSAELKDCRQHEFFDDGFSGTNFDRPSFEKMLEMIKKGEINLVIVKDFSRFGRDYIELGDYLERIFPFLGVRFISVNDNYDSEDYKGTTGGLDVVMKNIVYDYYSKDLSVKVKTAKYQKMKQGKYLGGHVPYGLMKDSEDKHKLIIDPEASAVVREVFDMALSGMKITVIARTLNEKGIETPADYYRRKHPKSSKFAKTSDLNCWNYNSVRRILKQEMYYGAVVGHKRQALCVGGKHTTVVPKKEQFIVDNRHEAIVSKEDFLKVQEMFRQRGETRELVDKSYPLYRKVKCTTCGRAMMFKENEVRGKHYRYFACPHAVTQTGDGGCCREWIKESDLNEIVWSAVKALLDLTDAAEKKLKEKKAAAAENGAESVKRLASLQKEKERCDSERFANVDAFMAGSLDKDIYQRRRAELTRKAEQLDTQISELEQKIKDAQTLKDDGLSDALAKMKKYSGEKQLTQKMVQALIEEVRVTDKEHMEIKWKFSDEVLRTIME